MEDVVGGDVASDFAEVANDTADIFANQVALNTHNRLLGRLSETLGAAAN